MRTILIIDDDIAIGNMEQEVLERAGYATRRAYSVTEALLVLKTMRPDLILLDLMLPGLSGEEISSHILDELSRLATHYGFIDGGRMVKEISAEELERAARKCMSLRVSDTVPLVPVLDRLGAEYTVISGNEVKLYTPMPVCVLSDELSGVGCRLLNVTEQDESLESFYMELLGGERHA